MIACIIIDNQRNNKRQNRKRAQPPRENKNKLERQNAVGQFEFLIDQKVSEILFDLFWLIVSTSIHESPIKASFCFYMQLRKNQLIAANWTQQLFI